MMYDIKIKPRNREEDGVTISATESQIVSLQSLQANGSVGAWIGKQYIPFHTIHNISPSSYQPPSPIIAPLLPKGKEESLIDERKRIRQRLNEIRKQLSRKGII